MGKVKAQNVRRCQPAFAVNRHIRHLFDLTNPPIAHATPFGKPGQARHLVQMPAQSPRRFGQRHVVAALARRAGCLQSSRSGADDQHTLLAAGDGHPFRMPASAPFFGHGRILRAADRYAQLVGRKADVATDALADILGPPRIDFRRQKRVGDRRARGPDQVQHPAAHHRCHRIGAGEPADADHRLGGHRLDEAYDRLLPAFRAEARGQHV